MIRGTGVSSGIADGTAYVLACSDRAIGARRTVQASEVDGELARFEVALGRAEQELLALKKSVSEKIGASEADIFTAQALVLRSPSFRDQVSAVVRENKVNAEAALAESSRGSSARSTRSPTPPCASERRTFATWAGACSRPLSRTSAPRSWLSPPTGRSRFQRSCYPRPPFGSSSSAPS